MSKSLPRFENHPIADIFPMLSAVEIQSLADNIAANGLHHAITLHENKILDGRNRYQACLLASVEPRFVDFGGNDPVAFVISENLQRRHMGEAARAACAAKLANMPLGGAVYRSANLQTENVSQSQAAAMLNVSPRSVATAKAIDAEAPELTPLLQTDAVSLNMAAKVAELPDEERQEFVEQIKEGEKPKEAYKHVSDDSYEWYTPLEFVRAVRKVMGEIDLDPASCEIAQGAVRAKKFYSKQDDGLKKKWAGKVFVNPPYCMPEVEQFADKAIAALNSGAVTECIFLINNSTDTKYFHRLIEASSAICFTLGRVKFYGPNASGGGARQGQVFFYFGSNARKFKAVFSKLGAIVKHEH